MKAALKRGFDDMQANFTVADFFVNVAHGFFRVQDQCPLTAWEQTPV